MGLELLLFDIKRHRCLHDESISMAGIFGFEAFFRTLSRIWNIKSFVLFALGCMDRSLFLITYHVLYVIGL